MTKIHYSARMGAMVIGVDAGCLGIDDDRLKVGVYYVAYNLLKQLAKLDKKNIYLLYSFHPINKKLLNEFPVNSKNIILSSAGWLNLQLPLSFLKQRPHVFLALSQAMPYFHPFKTIGFVHAMDFNPLFHPESNTKLKRNSEYMIQKADELVTTSEFLKKSIFDIYKRSDVTVTPLGVDQSFFNPKTTFKLSSPYFLFIGSLKPSKNIPTVIKAFSFFLKKTNKNYKLLCVGSDFWEDPEIKDLAKKGNFNNHIRFIPSLPQSKLPALYKSAAALVSPSLYEGFGMPFLEAMASGCPVIGTRLGGIAEVVKECGILVPDPLDSIVIGNAMVKLEVNSTLRKTLISKGKKRAKEFTWERFGKQFYEVIKKYGK